MFNFTRATTGHEVAKAFSSVIEGKTILITGGTLGGLGAEAAARIVQHSPRLVILTARTQAKIDETFAAIRKETPDAALRSVRLDISSLADVRRAAQEINDMPETIDVLIHNAGVAGTPLNRTADGFTQTLATNHIGPFLLTKLLLPKMLASVIPHPRIVTVSSGAHMFSAGFRWGDPHYHREQEYSPLAHYNESKVLSVLFAAALCRKSGGRLQAYAADPGQVFTDVFRYLPTEQKRGMGVIDKNGNPTPHGFRTLDQGIGPYLTAAFDPSLADSPGAYVGPSCRASSGASFAQGVDLEQKMWEASESWIGERFEIPE